MSPPLIRHRVVTDWEACSITIEETFGEPDIVYHLERMADSPGSFDAALFNLAKDLDAQPWLVDDAGYGWVTDRSAYRFAQEAINQGRILNALGGLLSPNDQEGRKAASNIAARQGLRWRLDDAEPYCFPYADWRFVVIPFAWDNVISILMLAIRSHAARTKVARRLFPDPSPVDDWRRPAKGLLLAAMPIPEARTAIIDSFLLAQMRNADAWFADAIISIDEFFDEAVRSLWAASSDWVVGHEVTHALLHRQHPWSLDREMQADRGGLIQMMAWTRPRDLAGLSGDLSPNFWDYVSARLGLMMLTLTSELQHRLRGSGALSMLDATQLRSAHISEIVRENAQQTTITSEEFALFDALDEAFDNFLADLAMLQASIPGWAMARARQAARKADKVLREELRVHKAKGGGLILPD